MKRKTAVAVAIALAVLFSAVSFCGAYPNPGGYVTDQANVLSPKEKSELEALLSAYEQKTGIEIAVVTVSSLEGRESMDYAVGLASKWGVGKKGENNGVVFLIAPNERKTFIATGYGIEADLPDAETSRIVNNIILPKFKARKMSEGITAGTLAIIETLRDTPVAMRKAERAAAAERARLAGIEREKENALSRQKMQGFMIFLGFALLGVAGLALLAYIIAKVVKARRYARELEDTRSRRLAAVTAKLAADETLTVAEARLKELRKDFSEGVWGAAFGSVEQTVKGAPAVFGNIEAKVRKIQSSKARASEDQNNDLALMLSELNSYAGIPAAIDGRLAEYKKAKHDGEKLLAALPKKREAAEAEVFTKDVADITKSIFAKAEDRSREAKKFFSKDERAVNWLLGLGVVAAATGLYDSAREAAKADKAQAREAREEGPKLLAELPEKIEDAEKKVVESGVASDTKKMVKEAKKKYAEAEVMARKLDGNWVPTFILLSAAAALLAEAFAKAANDRESYSSYSSSSSRRSSDDSPSISSGSWSSGGGGSSSSDSGSFGGFGGGSFGGGGSGGSW